MVEPNQPVHRDGQLGRSQRPAFLQQEIVDVLHVDAGVFAENIERLEDVLQVDQPDFPRPLLLLDNSLERVGCRAMAASRVEIYEIELLHRGWAVQGNSLSQKLNG